MLQVNLFSKFNDIAMNVKRNLYCGHRRCSKIKIFHHPLFAWMVLRESHSPFALLFPRSDISSVHYHAHPLLIIHRSNPFFFLLQRAQKKSGKGGKRVGKAYHFPLEKGMCSKHKENGETKKIVYINHAWNLVLCSQIFLDNFAQLILTHIREKGI